MININRLSIKVAGESGQGINAIGEVVAKALKNAGYYTYGYREYPSVIKGGHASHQTDFSSHPINSSSEKTDVLLCFSRVSLHAYLQTLRTSGQIIHMLPQLEFTLEEEKFIKKNMVKIAYLAADNIAKEVGGSAIMANSVMVGALWSLLNLPPKPLYKVLTAEFAHKKDVIKPNLACIKIGHEADLADLTKLDINFSRNNKRKDDALLTGNHLVALGAVAAGVRAYFAYPMTPSSSILTYLANIYHDTSMLVKQLDDEISVAQFAIGANFMGTRALVATSGGGFDLMTESVSLSAMTETPFVCILGQRPGPATGLPTWTSASDLNLAIYAGHGEAARCVIAIGDSNSAYTVIQNAFNLAEKYQIPVIVLTDKQIAESLYQVENLQNDVKIQRHLAASGDIENLTPQDRFKITESGISPRWLPGQSEATYVGNSDEHLADGSLTEDSQTSREMIQKRIRKLNTLLQELPEPQLIGPENSKLTLVGWGSVKNTVLDVMQIWNEKFPQNNINYLHYEYIYPLRLKKFNKLVFQKQPIILIENNAFGQLGQLITQQTGYLIKDKLLKFDGRPFFIEDITSYLEERYKK
ncbi:MAG: 2-oxoglutarate ferredoxin oxidoreductase alpha subunit [Candidatus Curtissbacteria bacterium GW2011_GWA1_40_9]|uniref:2-oxoglutarate ferredoxin oxidoreductase alpha subunit n=1 Tax=Candidatus Curtissbacteria bacterium GW2011_GWA1_40_9 TaxID=1618408 RepID=A0A0G0W260_9BACT|nr:MAG: 2-oxoglutarate ferredoxin oxidoreductase alpha subunit [Candidatus Curtissbacteria bacterium GW2011_GWA1_40_9]